MTAGRQDGRTAHDAAALPSWRPAVVPSDPAPLLEDAGIAPVSGVLHAAGVSLELVAEAHGTPAYVYNADTIRKQFRALDSALAGVPHRICYAVKANSNLGVLRVLRDLGAGADIVSLGELRRALAAGFAADHIVFSGVGKTVAELEAAIDAGIAHVNIESLAELDVLVQLTSGPGAPVPVGIRVNPDVMVETHEYISTGKRGSKFGIPLDQVRDAAAIIRRHPRLELVSLAMHIGSQLNDVAPYADGARRLASLVEQVRADGTTTLRELDVGGGLGIRYRDEAPMSLAAFSDALLPLVSATGLTLLLEPGRFLVGQAGLLLTRVLFRKHSGGKEFVIVDAGMNDLERPSRYQAYHGIVPVRARSGEPFVADVVGPVCETGDFFAQDRELALVERGDLVAILGAGAYGFTMASNYNTRPLPPEVIVEGGRSWLARPRQSVDDLFAGERVADDA